MKKSINKILLIEIINQIKVLGEEISDILYTEFSSYLNVSILNKDKGSSKKIQDITNELDHKIGKIYLDKLINKYTNILKLDSEETEESTNDGYITVRIDPIDGSKHLKEGLPYIASTLSLVLNDNVIFGMVINPFPKSIFTAEINKGAFLNGKKVSVSNKDIKDDLSFVMIELPTSVLSNKNPQLFDKYLSRLNKFLEKSYRVRNIGIGSLMICYVAAGLSPAYINFSNTTKIYDVEAAILIAKEAGAKILSLKGEELSNVKFSSNSSKKYLKDSFLVTNPSSIKTVKSLLV